MTEATKAYPMHSWTSAEPTSTLDTQTGNIHRTLQGLR